MTLMYSDKDILNEAYKRLPFANEYKGERIEIPVDVISLPVIRILDNMQNVPITEPTESIRVFVEYYKRYNIDYTSAHWTPGKICRRERINL